MVLFNITNWINYGKFGLLNIYSRNTTTSYSRCEDGDIYKWSTSDWRFSTSNLVKTSKILKDSICTKKYSYVILLATFDDVINFGNLMGGGRITPVDDLNHFASLVNLDIDFSNIDDLGYWVPYKDTNGSYVDIGNSGKIFAENRWCEGQPNNEDHRCISCDFCCYDVACNAGSSYALVQIESNASLTLRF